MGDFVLEISSNKTNTNKKRISSLLLTLEKSLCRRKRVSITISTMISRWRRTFQQRISLSAEDLSRLMPSETSVRNVWIIPSTNERSWEVHHQTSISPPLVTSISPRPAPNIGLNGEIGLVARSTNENAFLLYRVFCSFTTQGKKQVDWRCFSSSNKSFRNILRLFRLFLSLVRLNSVSFRRKADSLGFIGYLYNKLWINRRLFNSRVSLKGKTVLITGGNAGIGYETVKGLLERGESTTRSRTREEVRLF